MEVINLFGEPSCGKSTTAAGLFFLMKHRGLSVELITEYAKDCVWEGRKETLNDQLYITAKQNHKLERLNNQVDYVITDSPLFLGILYSRHYKRISTFSTFVMELFESYRNTNILLTRAKPYVQAGRIQTEEQAKDVRKELIDLLTVFNVPYHQMTGDNDAPRKIFEIITLDRLAKKVAQ